MNHWLKNPKAIILGPLALLLAIILACGSSATATSVPATAQPTAITSGDATSPPAPTVEPTDVPEVMTGPAGQLTVGQKELGPYVGNPKLIGNPQIFLNNAIPITETLTMSDFDTGQAVPMLTESWSVSDDGQVWTFNIRKGVQFHKGFGEMTVEDVVFSHRQMADSELHARSAQAMEMFFAEDGSQTTPDDYTWVVDMGQPFSEVPMFEIIRTPGAVGAWVVSKKQWDQDGEEEANNNTAATGPWEIVEARTGEFWRMNAVEDHWRQTPSFAVLEFQEIPEESARIAGFKTGILDTFVMALDTISEVEAVEGALLMQVPNSVQSGINFYGQLYLNSPATGEPWDSFNPELPWVSASSDTSTEEWDTARKVRLAMSIAIDRQAIIDELLQGFGHQLTLKDWMGHEDRLPDPNETWGYDPDRAMELLADAGYPDGFSATLTTAIRGAPSEVEACEAVAQYWDAIGIDVNFQEIPYTTYRPQAVARTYQGISCHSVGSRLSPIQGMASFLNKANFSWGSEHPFLEEKIQAAQKAVDVGERTALEDEIAAWEIEHVFSEVGLYVVDNVWPVGPNIAPWDDFIKKGDLRQINGYEYIKPR